MMTYATEQQIVVTAALIVLVGLAAMFLGRWWGIGQGREQGYEEREKEEREQAKARRTHPVYRNSGKPAYNIRADSTVPPVAYEAWLAHEDQALTLANERPEHSCCIHGGFSGEHDCCLGFHRSAAITDLMVARWKTDNDLWMAEHGLSDS